jgi:putative transposase
MSHPEEQRRHQAVARYLAGDKIEDICREMPCAKSWLFKWKARYRADDPSWAQAQRRRPRRHPNKTAQAVEQAVIDLHRTLRHSSKGGRVASVQQALKQQGTEPVPSLRTIYRILQRHEKG